MWYELMKASLINQSSVIVIGVILQTISVTIPEFLCAVF